MGRPSVIHSVGFDSSCLIGLIQGDSDFLCLESTLEKIDSGLITLVLSTAIMVEVLPNDPRDTNLIMRHRIQQLLDSSKTKLVDLTPVVARKAVEYQRTYHLKSMDSIHLATAVIEQIDIFFVRDGKFPTEQFVDGIWISQPYNTDGEHLFNQG